MNTIRNFFLMIASVALAVILVGAAAGGGYYCWLSLERLRQAPPAPVVQLVAPTPVLPPPNVQFVSPEHITHASEPEKPKKAEDSKSAPDETAKASAPVGVKTLDFDRLMRESRPGMILSRYVEDYKRIMDESMNKLDASAQAAQKAAKMGVYASLQDDRRYLEERKVNVEKSAKEYLRSIVKASLSQSPLEGRPLVMDASVAFFWTPEQDVTAEIVARLAQVEPKLPALPQIKTPQTATKKSVAAHAKPKSQLEQPSKGKMPAAKK